MIANFEIGKVYNRRRDIHDRFGGQRQGGKDLNSRLQERLGQIEKG